MGVSGQKKSTQFVNAPLDNGLYCQTGVTLALCLVLEIMFCKLKCMHNIVKIRVSLSNSSVLILRICNYQSHCIKVPQGDVFMEQKMRFGLVLGWLAILKKNLHFFAHENMKKTLSKVAHNRPQIFFSIANRPKTSPNLRYFSQKSPTTRLLYNDFVQNTQIIVNVKLKICQSSI